MLQINDLSYRIEGRVILDNATVTIPGGHKVGLVGRNGAGKTTLLKLILGELSPDNGSITLPRLARLGHVAQEAPGGPEKLIDWVLACDTQRARLLREAETATDPERIAEVHVQLADMGAHTAPSRAAAILSGLGFDEDAQQRACSEFSGGWRMRLALAGVLLTTPEVLLLDEPTNYLDLEGTVWLEQHLRSYPETVVIVSHDRDLLNRSVGSIVHLSAGRLSLYAGGYDAFEETLRERQRLQNKLRKKQEDERRRIEAFVDRFRAKATKARQAQSRIKALARMKPIAGAVNETVVPFRMPSPDKPLQSPLIALQDVCVGYEPGQDILRNISLNLDRDDRIALLGANGNGKSTFAKLLVGELAPTSGKLRRHHKLQTGYFAQHQLDALQPRHTPYDHVAQLLPDATEAQKRAKLADFGFSADKAATRCEDLSGGEKARLLLSIKCFAAPHLLILDEPTNHLDVDSRQALIEAICAFDGAVILISHDRHLVAATADRLWVVEGGTVNAFDGDLENYGDQLLQARRQTGKAGSNGQSKSNDEAGPVSAEKRRRAAAAMRKNLAPLRKAADKAVAIVEQLQCAIDALDEQLAAPDLYQERPKLAERLMIDRGNTSKKLEAAELAWLEAQEAYEKAKAASEEAMQTAAN